MERAVLARLRPRWRSLRGKPASFSPVVPSQSAPYAIDSEKNEDYLSNKKKLAHSLPYVVNELSLLKPAVVLLPHKIWENKVVKGAMCGASPHTHFIPAPQFNARVVNCCLKKYDRSTPKVLKNIALTEWMSNLISINKTNAWRYIAMLEDVIAKQEAE